MTKKLWVPLVAVAGISLCQIGGCRGLLPTVPIEVALGSNGGFTTISGVAVAKTFTSNFNNTSGVDLGSGNLQLDPDDITVTSEVGKIAQPIPDNCDEACNSSGLPAATCNLVCTEGEIVVTVWVSAANEADPQETGDQYGPYEIHLDDDGNVEEIHPANFALQPETIAAVNAGSAKISIEVISPYTGTITIDALVVNAGL